jgi:hypothetical protein
MKRTVGLLLILMLGVQSQAQQAADSLRFQEILAFARQEKLSDKSAGERVVRFGTFLLGTPYGVSTLEAPGPEGLQVNFRALDCTTLVETVLALSRIILLENPDLTAYKECLTRIRYRDGKLDGYPSRLHYASEWIADNVRKGFLSYVPLKGAETFRPTVDYMTKHPSAYPALKADTTQLPRIAAMEAEVNRLSFRYLPKQKLSAKGEGIRSGDIVAITTGYPGLDFAHLGIAVRKNGKTYLLHASSTGNKVLISETPLASYLAGIRKHTGIVVLRSL